MRAYIDSLAMPILSRIILSVSKLFAPARWQNMRFSSALFPIAAIILFTIGFLSCSNGENPVIPVNTPDQTQQPSTGAGDATPATDDSVYCTYANENYSTFQGSFIAAYVRIDPVKLEGEIIPARNASAIGDVFDADLTQFLRYSPCNNCLQMGAMNVNEAGNILVEFKMRHPFENAALRPDLHAFDVRGILIAPGSTQFPMTTVHLPGGTEEPALGNVGMLVNADGYTSHFDSLAERDEYFGAPKNYTGNINPFKRFFENPSGGTFDPLFPEGHNVLRTGAGWASNIFELKPPSFGNINFVFIADIAYGVSAKFSNRYSPLYYLPWFNRKEAWKTTVTILSNNLIGGNLQSTALIRATASDWQAGLQATPEYPDCALSCIPVKSDVKKVTVEIPSVTAQLQNKTTPDSGTGSPDNPYIFNFPITNELGAPSGIYKGIVAVRDDLDGTNGPMGIPEGPGGFPLEGPDLTDYTAYYVFDIEVAGSPNRDPIIDTLPYSVNNPAQERSLQLFIVSAHDPDGDELHYFWQQLSPDSPTGVFEDITDDRTYWFSPNVSGDMTYTFSVTIDDGRGGIVTEQFELPILNVNLPPFITLGPYSYPTIIAEGEYVDTVLEAQDPDFDTLTYNWVQIAPASPVGTFNDPNTRQPRWTAPAIPQDTIFRLRAIVSDGYFSATGQIDVPVSAINESPVGTLAAAQNPAVYLPSRTVILGASFTDPDGNNIVLYEWDEDYDGVAFNVDKSTGATPLLATSFAQIGSRVIAVRATDNGSPAKKGIATCNIAIEGKWGNNVVVTDNTPPSVKFGSHSSQTPVAGDENGLYMIYLFNTGSETEIRLAKSLDSGITFEPTVIIDFEPVSVVVESPTIEISGNYIWTAWKEDNDVRLARSINSGSSFEPDISLSPVSTAGDHIPSIACDPVSGNIYVAFADKDGSANGIITLTKSTDNGASFTPSASIVTSSTAATSEANVKVSSTGTVFVGWVDDRNSANGDIYYARSTNAGDSFGTNRRVNLDYSNAGSESLSMDIGPDNEVYFAWRDKRESSWKIYFANTTTLGTGVLFNSNATPIIPQIPLNPHIYVNDHCRIYIAFDGLDGTSDRIMITSADYAGANFDLVPAQLNDAITSSIVRPMLGLTGNLLPSGIADNVIAVWTDFENGESGGFGDCYSQRYLCHAY
jgi:hypothetical protein